MSTYAGRCVGGPYDGMDYAHHKQTFSVAVRLPNGTTEMYSYVLSRIDGVVLWTSPTMPLSELMSLLINGYHPTTKEKTVDAYR